MDNVIGTTTTYNGTEHPWLTGIKVKVVTVLKNGNNPDVDVDSPEYLVLHSDYQVEQRGGVSSTDRLEVQPWIESKQRFSFVTSDVKATDLDSYNTTKRGE